ncbi:MaoC family dehydratase [Solihabitans fulvus]|uniref:MaoC family dehydratase n=1 Tax=Solihabitans fulvus TaxID=1892852 RepID=UPI001CB75E36|nr:MaoC family dehydratase [Solihabitans fulvus]
MTIAFEDLTEGLVVPLGEVKIDREDMLEFARRFDPQAYHLDEEAGRRSVFGGLSASGWFTASLWMRAYVDHLIGDSTAQGSPGGRELSWLAPVFPGDVLRCEVTVVGARRSKSRPGLGIVELSGTANRGDECVLRFTFAGLFGCRE